MKTCTACGHEHQPALGGICIGCPCEERPDVVPVDRTRLLCWSCRGLVLELPRQGCRTHDVHEAS